MFDFVLRLYVVLVGLAHALLAGLAFIVDLGRLVPFQDAFLSLLYAMPFATALWLSGFGACRGWFRWLVVLGFARPFGVALLGSATVLDLPLAAAITALAILLFGALLPVGAAVFLLFKRPPSFLLALERVLVRSPGTAPAA
jgi:hypothetical protein